MGSPHRTAAPATEPGTDDTWHGRVAEATERLAPIAEEYPFTPRFHAHPDGVVQHYVDEGPRTPAAALCLHGNPTWSFLWRNVIRTLSPRGRVVALDHIGCGLSDKPAHYGYRLEQHIANVERVVDALGLERITLIVHDWGGAIGMGFARRHPERIERIVVTNTAAFRSRV